LPETFYSLATPSHSSHTSAFQPITFTADIQSELSLSHALTGTASSARPPNQPVNFASQFLVFCAVSAKRLQFALTSGCP